MRLSRALLLLTPLAVLAACADDTVPPTSPDGAGLARHAGLARYATAEDAVDLGTLSGGTTSIAWDVNDHGVVVGASQVGAGELARTHAFRWTAGSGMQDLGTLGGDFSTAFAINRHGAAVGLSTTTDGETHLVSWDAAGAIHDLGTIPGSFLIGVGGISDRGEIVGSHCPEEFPCTGFRWSQQTGLTPVAVAQAGEAYFADVNRRGDVAGRFCCGRATYYGMFLLEADGAFHDIGGVTDGNAGANALNAHGVVVGSDQPDDDAPQTHLLAPVLWSSSGGLRVLGSLGGDYGFASDVNDRGEVVGGSMTTPGDCCATNAFYWSERAGMVDLGPGRANAINGRGTVVGVRDGRATLWTAANDAAASRSRPDRAPILARAAMPAVAGRCGRDPAIVASKTALQRCLTEAATAAR